MTNNASRELAESLRASVGRFVRYFRALDQLPENQAAVLGMLVRGGSMTRAELARQAKVRHQSMRRTVDLLLTAGLAQQVPDAHDRRQHLVDVTPEGRRLLADVRLRRSEAIARELDDLTPRERELLARIPELLDKLSHSD